MPSENLSNVSDFGITIIVPLLNEADIAEALVEHLVSLEVEQVVIVDGGSTDATPEIMQAAGFDVIQSSASRAKQMNAGANKATQTTLLFLHADTRLPQSYKAEVAKSSVWGRFDVCFDDPSGGMSMIAFFMNLRSRISSVATGDQAIFINKSVFESIGGFPDFPIMEDVALSKRLRQLHRPYNSRLRVTTSARRWQQHGVVKTVFKMWWYRLAYFFGLSPHRIKEGYDDVR